MKLKRIKTKYWEPYTIYGYIDEETRNVYFEKCPMLSTCPYNYINGKELASFGNATMFNPVYVEDFKDTIYRMLEEQ